MIFVIPYPAIDPVLVEIGPFVVRWYALAYIFGLLGGWLYVRRLAKGPPPVMGASDVDDFLVWATLAVVIGGRLGYVVFYKPGYYLGNPLEILAVWRGGMSFHGGLIGVIVAGFLFTKRRGIAFLPFADAIACAAPIGLFLGRIANFINGELYGRPSEVPWAMVFPAGGPAPRHPSQLYEAALEGIVLFVVLHLLWRSEGIRCRPGILLGALLAGYALARFVAELFREPDAHLGFLVAGTTMGQWLSLPMLIVGLYFVVRARRTG